MKDAALILPASSAFPPSFEGNWLTFAFALFSLISMSALSIATIWRYAYDGFTRGWAWTAPLTISRMIMVLLLSTFVMGAVPDVCFLLAWGEVEPETLSFILLADRFLDGCLIFPFCGALFLLIRGEPAILFQLTKEPLPVDIWPTRSMIKRQSITVALCLFIAVGVTVAR